MRGGRDRQRGRPRCFTVVWAALVVCLLCAAGPAVAADTGLVVLKNGTRILGEVKSLEMAKLELSTIGMGVIYIEWDKVVELTAPEYFEVELFTGERHYGTLGPAPGAMLGVTLNGKTEALALVSVVRIRRLKQSFWSRIDGSINLGASYTQSSGIGQGSISANVGARRERYEWSSKLDTTVTVQPDQPQETRSSVSGGYNWLLRRRWFIMASGKAEHNTDLGLQLRSSAAFGAGRYLIQSNRSLLGTAAGVSLNREDPIEGDSTANAEAFFGASYEFFTYDTPKTSITTTFVVYPSLNVGGRVRTDTDVSLKREIVTDFTVGATLYDTYDSKPPTDTAKKHDVGFTLSIGWVF